MAAPGSNAENAALCEEGGYLDYTRTDGTTFKNEGQCVKYAAQGNALVPVAETRCREAAVAVGVDPNVFTIVAGTENDDTFTTTNDIRDLICGFGGADYIVTLSEGDVFLGGDDNDSVGTIGDGYFNGGAGDDSTGGVHGTFHGGDANYGGSFGGGAGDNRVVTNHGGIFYQEY